MEIWPSGARRLLRWLGALALVFFIGGLGGLVFDRELLPRLAAWPALSRFDWMRRLSDNVTIVQKTEQVVIREDDTVERVVSQPATAVVSLILVRENRAATQQTGVLLTNDGLAVTYALAPDPEARATMLLFDGTTHPARFVGHDRLMNLTYYRIEGVNTPAIALANSDDSRVGRKLIAIGNAAVEYQNRLSLGVLGHKNRTFNLSGKTVASSEQWEGVFEMDMPQAESFVGGPAIGFNGEMVGIVGMQTLDGAKQFFLLPANAVRTSFDRLIVGTLPDRPILGAYYLSLTKAYSIARGLSRDRGALIYSPSGQTGLSVIAGSPAERAGLRYGDIVIALDGQEINLDRPLSVALGQFKRGDTITLLVLRDDDEINLPVKL